MSDLRNRQNRWVMSYSRNFPVADRLAPVGKPAASIGRRGFILVLLIGSFIGCGDSTDQKKIDSAKQIVAQGLDAWKAGQEMESLKSLEVPIDFYDDDWKKSAALVEYELGDSWVEVDGTARCSVRLKVQYPGEEAREVVCSYQIVEEPGIKVARDPMS